MLSRIRDAGVVGAGGAGFPAHEKLNARVDTVIANGAECEPLLRVDQQLMEREAGAVLAGLRAAMAAVGAQDGVICLKAHYRGAVSALRGTLRSEKRIRLHLTESYYPAGDEQQMIYEVTRRVVPPGGLPRSVGCAVSNVGTLADIARAMEGVPVTHKYVTVGGAVARPCTVLAPVGAPLSLLLEHAGGTAEDCGYLLGGPCMGEAVADLSAPVTKTTAGLLAIPRGHPLWEMRRGEVDYRRMQSVCCQCTLCTQLCPRAALGLGTSPHKAMRSLVAGADLMGDANAVLTCCGCGVCTYHACGFGLDPAQVMRRMKESLSSAGKRAGPRPCAPDRYIADKRLPGGRLLARLGIGAYDLPAPMETQPLACETVRIPSRMHIGAPGMPLVKVGDEVRRGQPVYDIPPGALGARAHASVDGTVTEITPQWMEIRKTP